MKLNPRPSQMSKPNIHWVDPKALKPYENNAKIHSNAQIKKIANSIKEFGFLNPIIIDSKNNIIAGHGRLEAALSVSLSEVPVTKVEHLSSAQIKAYRIADNRLAEDAKWNERLLAIEIEALTVDTCDLDITLTGFETGEIDVLLDSIETEPNETDNADALPNVDENEPVTSQLGDLWLLGDHRLYCGDALERASYGVLMAEMSANMVISDPPYNVPIDGHVSGKGKVRHREFDMASGEMSSDEFEHFLKTAFERFAENSVDGALHYIFMDWRHMNILQNAGSKVYRELKNLCVWVKKNGGMGSQYRSRHELVFVYKHGTAAHINNVRLGKFGRNRTNVWEYSGVNSFGKYRDEALAMHPTVKPAAMIKDAIQDASNRGDIILDPFLGSGTTIIAAHEIGRRCFGMELDPRYVDTAVKRWQALTGDEAVHAETGLTFIETSKLRTSNRENDNEQ